jgi:hypothetical protein
MNYNNNNLVFCWHCALLPALPVIAAIVRCRDRLLLLTSPVVASVVKLIVLVLLSTVFWNSQSSGLLIRNYVDSAAIYGIRGKST